MARPAHRRRRWPRIVAWITAPLAVLTVLFIAVAAWLYGRADATNVGDLAFDNPLRIPST